MNHPKPSGEVKAVAVATANDLRETIRRKSKLKGRQADDVSLAEVRRLIGEAPHRRDLLIENLHKLNDEYRVLHDRHLVALAKEMNLPMAEVYEVATFYHHFEVVRGDDPVADITVRVCDGVACELAGAQNLLAKLPAILGNPKVKVVAAPCVGRCEQAPVAVVHQYPVLFATADKVKAAVSNKVTLHPLANDNGSFEPAALAEQGVSASVIDLRSLWPWDRDTVLADCARTGRLLVVHDAVQVAGFGAEVVATAAELTRCKVARLGAPRIPVGYAACLENVVRIQPDDAVQAARQLVCSLP